MTLEESREVIPMMETMINQIEEQQNLMAEMVQELQEAHFSIYFAKHGKDYDIDVAFGSFGENPIGMQDKMTSIDVLRMAENLQCKVVVPIHWDVWTNFQADCDEIKVLYDFKKDRNEYKFHPFFWQVGGKYTYPADKDKIYYHHRRGFEDCFEAPQNIPFRSCL